MASPVFEAGRPGPLAVHLARLVERALRQSGAVDTEALCVVAGRAAWALRVDVTVLDHGGNLVDACVLAALAACMAYRRPDVTVGGEAGGVGAGGAGGEPLGDLVVVHSREQREPLPLTIHHHPIAVTWALFKARGQP
jgi:exosome complex RNA-binding protein Rrp42 (RNase PH superfamily)